MNPYTHYYLNQLQYGGGLGGFAGVKVQRGHGFFSRMFSGIGSFVRDLLPSIGKKALPSAINLAQDVLAGENVAQSAKKRLKEAGRNVASETLDKIKSKIQTGSGIRNRRVVRRQILNDSITKIKKKKYKSKKRTSKKSNKKARKKRKVKRKHV